MIYYRCKCGDSYSYGSMGPARCTRCPKCGSNLASGPSNHADPKPHVIARTRVDADEGEAYNSACLYCHESKKKIMERNEPWIEPLTSGAED